MNTKIKPYLLYVYLGLFLLSSYFLRDILAFAQSNISLIAKIIIFFVLGYAYKNMLPYGKLSSGLLFVLFLMVGWELSNFLPLISLYLFMLLPVEYKYSLGVEWFVLIKPLGVLAYLWFRKVSLLSYINALTAQTVCKYSVNNVDGIESEQKNTEEKELNVFSTKKSKEVIDAKNLKSFFFINEKTKLITLFYKKNKFSFSQVVFTNEKKYRYFFLNSKKTTTPSINNITIDENKLIINLKNDSLVFNTKEIDSDLVNNIKFLKETRQTEDNYLSIY